ncbi:MAG: DUF2829 domain-containing protein [Lactobacillus sp.]|nr:DUF2829 domain-containing protein [Lactobacillus sp.]
MDIKEAATKANKEHKCMYRVNEMPNYAYIPTDTADCTLIINLSKKSERFSHWGPRLDDLIATDWEIKSF